VVNFATETPVNFDRNFHLDVKVSEEMNLLREKYTNKLPFIERVISAN
jgi:hypothetical protein